MKRYFTIILITFISIPVFSQYQWVDQTNNGFNNNSIDYSIDAYDSLNAVVGGYYSQAFITTDGGNNWMTYDFSTVADSQDAIDASMPDPNHIWLATEQGMILNSTNGGVSWQIQFNDTNITKNMDYVEMFDSTNGVAMGDALTFGATSAVILKTTDGGAHWNSVNTQSFGGWSGDEWRRIDFVNMNVGYFFESGGNPQKLYKTTDGGAHWDTTNYSQVDTYSMVLKFYDENIGFSYNYDKIHYTLDGGDSWTTVSINDQGWGMDIAFIKKAGSFNVAVAGNGTISFSADTGKTWTADSTLKEKGIYAIRYPDSKHAWAITGIGGPRGVWYQKYDVVADLKSRDIIPDKFTLSQNYPNPFNPSTKIRYSLPQKGFVTIKVFDMLGRDVTNLINEEQNAGQHEVNFKANNLPSGIYFYRITAGGSAITKKMILLK